MSEQKTEQKPADHKAIREAARVGGDYTMVEVPDLRALLADLDAMRGALEETLLFCEIFSNRWDGQTVAHPFGMVERARAALKGAEA